MLWCVFNKFVVYCASFNQACELVSLWACDHACPTGSFECHFCNQVRTARVFMEPTPSGNIFNVQCRIVCRSVFSQRRLHKLWSQSSICTWRLVLCVVAQQKMPASRQKHSLRWHLHTAASHVYQVWTSILLNVGLSPRSWLYQSADLVRRLELIRLTCWPRTLCWDVLWATRIN